MFRTIFGKTLFEKRWTIFWWVLAVFVTNILLVQIFPPIRDAFSGMMENMPASLQGWFGESGEMWNSIEGYVGSEVMGQMSLILVVFAILFAISIFADEEKSGLLMSQLAKPIKRSTYYFQKYMAFLVASVVVVAWFILGAWIGTLVVGYPMSLWDFGQPTIAVYLMILAFGSLTFGLGAITGSKALPGIIVGFYATVGYFLTSMRTAANVVDKLSHITPFHYYNNPNVLSEGLEWTNVLILLAFIVVPIVVAWPVFRKRDIRTH